MERAVRKIVGKRNGEPKTIDDIWDVLEASADDSDDMHAESMQAIKKLDEKLTTHCVEANVRDARIEVLEEWQRTAGDRCADHAATKLKPMIESAISAGDQRHAAFHDSTFGEHERNESKLRDAIEKMMSQQRRGDPDDLEVARMRASFNGTLEDSFESHESWLIRLVATTAGKVAVGTSIAVLGGGIMLIINLLVYGRP
jgi:hypothetical protein